MNTSLPPHAPTAGFLSINPLCVLLEERDPRLAACLLRMQDRALNNWLPLMVPDRGSHSGLLHLSGVCRNVIKLIPSEKIGELTAGEIFLLLSAALLHDIGRAVPEALDHPELNGRCDEKHPLCRDELTPQPATPPCRENHWDHHLKSRDIINKAGYELGLPHVMAMQYCALLAYCHRLDGPPRKPQKAFSNLSSCRLMFPEDKRFRNTSIEPLGSVRIPMLAAVLRIADETENHWTRFCQDDWKDFLNAPPSNSIKAFRRRVEDVEFSHPGECIIMHLASLPKDKDAEPFADQTVKIEAILAAWSGELSPLSINFSRVYYELDGRLCRIEWSGQKQADIISDPMCKVFSRGSDVRKIKELRSALVALSRGTMGHREFPWSSIEAKVGRPLDARDRWLVERMGDWLTDTLHIDRHRDLVVLEPSKLERFNELT